MANVLWEDRIKKAGASVRKLNKADKFVLKQISDNMEGDLHAIVRTAVRARFGNDHKKWPIEYVEAMNKYVPIVTQSGVVIELRK